MRVLLRLRPDELTLVERPKAKAAPRDDFDAVFAMLLAGQIPTARLNTHRSSLEQAPAAFPHWLEPSSGVVKALIEI